MKKRFIIIGIISILVMMIGVSYAYFTSMIVGEGSPISVKAKKLAIIFTDTEEITGSVINPGWSTSKSFTVENKSGSVFYYDINIEDLINTFVTTGYLQYKITSSDGGYNMEEFIDIPKSEEARREVLKSGIEIEDNELHTYKVEFRYLNSEEDQSEDMGKIFDGRLSITESEILVVKYRVDGIIQDELPSKEIPYIVGGVECTNNAKGIWNEETETVELETPVKQTVCIVEFGEGYTVSMLTEHGEVVSPVSKVVGRIGSTTFNIEEKEGYTLEDAAIICDNGGEGSLEGNTITIRNIKQNNTCTVITNPIEITVTYNVNGGNALSPTNKTVIYTGTYGSLPSPTRLGYTFAGWYTALSGGSKVIESTEVTSTVNHTIYASWNANTITVTYDVNGGNTLSPNNKNVIYGDMYGNLPTPTRVGHTFVGWYMAHDGGTEVTTSTTLTNANNHSIYAHWIINSYNVTLNVINGYVTSQNPIRVNYGGSVSFTLAANSGYKLDGASVSCEGGSYNQAGYFLVSGVTEDRVCTITLTPSFITFTMNSECPDHINDNSGPCYIIKNNSTTVTYNGKTYTNCTIITKNMKYSTSNSERCLYEFTDVSNLRWHTSLYDTHWNYNTRNYGWVSCSVTLTCNL